MYKLDLTKMDGRGDFSCPRCGTIMSPDDITEYTYSLVEAKMSTRGLDELVIRCNKCGSHILLTGFSLLQRISETGEDSENRKEEGSIYIPHV